jgi:hypothetical protein
MIGPLNTATDEPITSEKGVRPLTPQAKFYRSRSYNSSRRSTSAPGTGDWQEKFGAFDLSDVPHQGVGKRLFVKDMGRVAGHRELETIRGIMALGVQKLNPQSNPQISMSCTTCAYLGSLRALLSRCKTKWVQIHTLRRY